MHPVTRYFYACLLYNYLPQHQQKLFLTEHNKDLHIKISSRWFQLFACWVSTRDMHASLIHCWRMRISTKDGNKTAEDIYFI